MTTTTDTTTDTTPATTAHLHHYRGDLNEWWCADCDTVTDYCDIVTALDLDA